MLYDGKKKSSFGSRIPNEDQAHYNNEHINNFKKKKKKRINKSLCLTMQ